jgi:uncharacterized protein (DUF1697 family)
MPVFISMLRGVNVGGHNRVEMDALRALYQSLKLEDPRTHVQSGNVIFKTKEENVAALTKKIQTAIEETFGFRPIVILRTAAELRNAVAINPFASRPGIEPGKLLVAFLVAEPTPEAATSLRNFRKLPEELHLLGRELFIYFPNGSGKSKLPWASLEKHLLVANTARNLNSVQKMLAIAEEMEAAQ